jgi:hypothetical protein
MPDPSEMRSSHRGRRPQVVDEQIGWNFLPVVVAGLAPLNVCLCHRQPLFFMRRTTAVYQGL